jgi:hypothetical protein
VHANGSLYRFGTFDVEEAAARAYDREVRLLFRRPVLNFLPDGSLNPYRKQGINSGPIVSSGGSPTQAAGAAAPDDGLAGDSLARSILQILDDFSDSDETAAAGACAGAAAPGTAAGGGGGAYDYDYDYDYDDDGSDPPRLPAMVVYDPVGALQSYATYRFAELDVDEELSDEGSRALRLLAMVSAVLCCARIGDWDLVGIGERTGGCAWLAN